MVKRCFGVIYYIPGFHMVLTFRSIALQENTDLQRDYNSDHPVD